MTKQLTLTNGTAKCCLIPERGALVTNLEVAGHPLLWLPEEFELDASSWPGGGLPLCFPFAGRLWNKGMLYQYDCDGTARHMPLHGFAFASSFGVKSFSKSEAKLILRDNEATRVFYPYSFQLELHFQLFIDRLRVDLTVTHTNSSHAETAMPIAVGWHPYFNLDNSPNTSLEVPSEHFHHVTPLGAAGRRAPTSELGPRPWPVRHPLLKSLILTDLKSPEASLTGNNTVKVIFGPASTLRHVVLWSNQLDKFYCVEPWMSLPDAIATPSGCQWLKEGESLSCWIEISRSPI